jgi:phosphoglycerate dehydrogenase-like enzyme
MTQRLVLLGSAAQGYDDVIRRHLATAWDIGLVDDRDAGGRLTEADVVVSMSLNACHGSAPRLKLIQVPGAGYDGIDFSAVPPGAVVCNVFEHEVGCAEYAMLGMLEWSIRLGRADAELRAGNWSRSSRFGGPPSGELRDRTVAIVGLGRIGREVARRARAFGMAVQAANRTVRDPGPDVYRLVGLNELASVAAQADFLVVSCALTSETRGLIDDKVLASMRPSAVVINVARGPVMDEEALWSALSEKRIGGAVLDVWWQNPPDLAKPTAPSRFPFATLPNVLMSPHIAGWTTGTVARRGRFMAENIERVARGEEPLNIVRPS